MQIEFRYDTMHHSDYCHEVMCFHSTWVTNELNPLCK